MRAAAFASRLAARPPYSYRDDPAVPPFPDDRPLIVFDGVCALCSGFVRFVVRHDHARAFRFVSAQSPLGQALMRHWHLDPVNYESNLLIVGGRAFGKMAAFVRIMHGLGGRWRLAGLVGMLPARAADWLYDRIALNRYRLFGRTQACMIPDPSWRDRLLD